MAEEAQILGYLFQGKSDGQILAKNGLGYNLGESFASTSGHPAAGNRGCLTFFILLPFFLPHFHFRSS
jgi:hypothetical protein